jgi:HEPN domain-containing protein
MSLVLFQKQHVTRAWRSLLASEKMVRDWFKKAHTDLLAAKYLLPAGEQFWPIIAFHCQQSVEKAIKGVLAQNLIRFDKTHNITELLNLLSQVDSELAKKLNSAKGLTQFAIAVRYPDAAIAPLTQSLIDHSVKTAGDAYTALSNKI